MVGHGDDWHSHSEHLLDGLSSARSATCKLFLVFSWANRESCSLPQYNRRYSSGNTQSCLQNFAEDCDEDLDTNDEPECLQPHVSKTTLPYLVADLFNQHNAVRAYGRVPPTCEERLHRHSTVGKILHVTASSSWLDVEFFINHSQSDPPSPIKRRPKSHISNVNLQNDEKFLTVRDRKVDKESDLMYL